MMAAPTAWYPGMKMVQLQCLLLRGFTYQLQCCWCTGTADRAFFPLPSRALLSEPSPVARVIACPSPSPRPDKQGGMLLRIHTYPDCNSANGWTRKDQRISQENTGSVRSLLSSYASQSGQHSIGHSRPRTAINLHSKPPPSTQHHNYHTRPAQQNEQGARLANSISYFNHHKNKTSQTP